MHSAPWTKASSSTSVCRRMAAIWAIDSSRGSTTRRTPSDSTSRMHSALLRVIWVEACSGNSGQRRCISRSSPRSCTSTASTPAATASRTVRSASSNSSPKTSVLSVKYPLTPRVRRNVISSGSSAAREVDGPGPGVEAALQPEVHGIGAIFDGRPRAVPIAGGGHQFGCSRRRAEHG